MQKLFREKQNELPAKQKALNLLAKLRVKVEPFEEKVESSTAKVEAIQGKVE